MSDEATERILNGIEAIRKAVTHYWIRVAVVVLLIYHGAIVTNYTIEVARSRKATEANTKAVEKQTKRLDLAIKLLEKVNK